MEIYMKPLARNKLALIWAALTALIGLEAVADGIGGSGVIRYFHSVVIDGTHYQTDHAVIRINGEPATEYDLKVGYHVSYRADGDTLEAWSMDYYDTVAGLAERITVIDASMQIGRIQIMNQRVETNADTWFHGVSFDEIEVGTELAISADWQPDGSLLATSVDAVARAEQILSGPIDRIDGSVLVIGGVSIDASNIGIAPNGGIAPDGVKLQAGEWIHALGYYDGVSTLHATAIVRQADRDIADLPTTIEGVLQRDQGVWQIQDYQLQIQESDEQHLASKLRPGRRATVTGILKPSGLLTVEEIRVEQRGRYRLDGLIEEIDPDDGSISVGGMKIALDERSSLRDDRDHYRWLGPENLAVHDAVSLIIEEHNGRLRARRITRLRDTSRLLSARVQKTDWWRGPRLMRKHQAAAYTAQKTYYNGRRISPFRLRWLMRPGDSVTLRWDEAGRVSSTEVTSSK
jgi:hypothetical protein